MSPLNSTKACRSPQSAPRREFADACETTGKIGDHGKRTAFVSYLDPNRAKYFRRKYVIDRCVGGALLVLSSPLTITLFGLVKLTSHGPGFYRQERVGLNGKTFQIIKLRSMVKNAEKPGQAVWCVKNDARVTPLGRVLRKLHLDELPQLWNVTKGDMSLVGPRPERPEICKELAEEIQAYYHRNSVKPGVTGLAQINLPPDESIEDVRRKQILDLRYIEEANSWLDARMIMATALRMMGVQGETVIKAMRLCRREYLRQEHPCLSEDLQDEFRIESQEPALVGAMASGSDGFHSEVAPRHPR